MKFLSLIIRFSKKLKKSSITLTDSKQELLVKQGREQFKKLVEKGLSVPVVFL